jgi:hypothetical protein
MTGFPKSQYHNRHPEYFCLLSRSFEEEMPLGENLHRLTQIGRIPIFRVIKNYPFFSDCNGFGGNKNFKELREVSVKENLSLIN